MYNVIHKVTGWVTHYGQYIKQPTKSMYSVIHKGTGWVINSTSTRVSRLMIRTEVGTLWV